MTKSDFLASLRDRLSGLPLEDIERTIDYYSEIIDDRIEDGLSEVEAVRAVGTPDEIITHTLRETSLPKSSKEKQKSNRGSKAWVIILLILGAPLSIPLLAAALGIVLSVYIVVWSVVFVLYSIAVSFAVSTAAGLLGALLFLIRGSFAECTVFFGVGLVMAGLAVIMFIVSSQFAKGILKLSKKMLLFIRSCFIGKGRAQ